MNITSMEGMRLVGLCVAVFGAIVLALTSAPPAPAATTATYDLWVWNVAGWTMRRASTTHGLIPAL